MGQYIHYLRSQLTLVRSITFSPNGQTLVVSGSSNSGGVELWNVQTGELTHTLDGNAGAVTSVAVSLNGDMLATGNVNGVIELWNIKTGKLIRRLQGHSSSVLAVAISSDSKTLISGSQDGTIKFWLIK